MYNYLVWLYHDGMQEKLKQAWRFNYLSHFHYSSRWDWGVKEIIIIIYALKG